MAMTESSGVDTRPLTVSEWFVTILILALPLVNIVMYLYWAFAEGVNVNKRNFCRASILWAIVGLVFGAILLAYLGSVGALQGQ
jgi:hypothetical protein